MIQCPRCTNTDVIPIPLAGDVDDYYCITCDRPFTEVQTAPRGDIVW